MDFEEGSETSNSRFGFCSAIILQIRRALSLSSHNPDTWWYAGARKAPWMA